MLHPVIESLLFLKLARNSICESIDTSKVGKKNELKEYIQNEASDYEIIHLITLGEMPEEKFNDVLESYVWDLYKKDIVRSYDYLTITEGFNEEDVDNIIFEMGPISGYGLSSAKPIMELHQHNGYFEKVLKENFSDIKKKFSNVGKELGNKYNDTKKRMDNKIKQKEAEIGVKWAANSAKRRIKGAFGKASPIEKAENLAGKGLQKWQKMSPEEQGESKGIAKGVGGAGLAAAGGYLAYKAYKALKKRKAAKKVAAEKAKKK